MNREQLEQKEKELDIQIEYLESILRKSHHSEESKDAAREALNKLKQEKKKIVEQMINTKD
jgi:hypothetical protein